MIDRVELLITHTDNTSRALHFLRNENWPRTSDIQVIADHIYTCEMAAMSAGYIADPLNKTIRYSMADIKMVKIVDNSERYG